MGRQLAQRNGSSGERKGGYSSVGKVGGKRGLVVAVHTQFLNLRLNKIGVGQFFRQGYRFFCNNTFFPNLS